MDKRIDHPEFVGFWGARIELPSYWIYQSTLIWSQNVPFRGLTDMSPYRQQSPSQKNFRAQVFFLTAWQISNRSQRSIKESGSEIDRQPLFSFVEAGSSFRRCESIGKTNFFATVGYTDERFIWSKDKVMFSLSMLTTEVVLSRQRATKNYTSGSIFQAQKSHGASQTKCRENIKRISRVESFIELRWISSLPPSRGHYYF